MKLSYVTLVDNRFLIGAEAMIKSLRKVSKLPITVMTCGEIPDIHERLDCYNVNIMPVDVIPNPHVPEVSARYGLTFTKLRAFNLTMFDKIVFLDADTLVLQPINDLFNKSHFAAAPDLGMALIQRRFNSGLFVAQPSERLFASMMSRIKTARSYDSGDQGFLNTFFAGRWTRLDYRYNALQRLYSHHPRMWRTEEIKVIHYVGPKPWNYDKWMKADKKLYKPLAELWYQSYYGDEVCLKTPE